MTASKEGDLRVYHIPQVPMRPFYVPVNSVKEGRKLIDVLAVYDLFQYQNRVKPDYTNASGLQRYEDGDWFDVDMDPEEEPYQDDWFHEERPVSYDSGEFSRALAVENEIK